MNWRGVAFSRLFYASKNTGLFFAAICILLAFHLLFQNFFPTASNTLGHDYGYFLPRLLDGYYWQHQNGVFKLQLFSPAFCGGVPVFANPQSPTLSFAQVFFNAFGPVTGIYVTLVVFAAIGFVGMYLLLNYCFVVSASLSFLGASLFMFNGFYISRMLIGHLTFHSFMLIPLIAFLLLSKQVHRNLVASIACALLFTYVFVSGNVNGLLPVIFSVFIISLTYRLVSVDVSRVYTRWLLSGTLSMFFCSSKLVAILGYMQNVNRPSIPIPGTETFIQSFQLAIGSVFLFPMEELGARLLVNRIYHLGKHEFEYGIGIVPIVLILASLIVWMKKRRINNTYASGLNAKLYTIIGLCICFCVPLILNYHNDFWHSMIRQIPVLGQSSNLLRWYSVYIPCLILLPVLFFDRLVISNKIKAISTIAGIFVLLLTQLLIDRDYYSGQPYRPQELIVAYNQIKTGQKLHSIERIVTQTDLQSDSIMERDNALSHSNSQLQCYEPLFGYQLESFPVKSLRPGLAMEENNGLLNVKNPVCYVFPNANNCAPGDHFSIKQKQQAIMFLNYKDFTHKTSVIQIVANLVTAVSVALCILYVFIIFGRYLVIEKF